ncbi:DUF397 domain-containing protein [Actinomadura fulvescens]|uniref:DUF397 domain-containing protein n=1 Tax=Actinomadura fulvescens TaxID=46160 RepID=A0ABN3P7I9_9ACTN
MDLSGARWRKSSYSGDNGGHCVELALVWRKSSHSGDNGGNCVELAAGWRKSSHSGDNGGECVELSTDDDVIAVRDSKDPGAGVLLFPRESFRQLTAQIKAAG